MPADQATFAAALCGWYRRHRRDLPWRRTRDPYAIWVSEIMLQQTRVDTAIDYYQRFLQRFPTVQALAAADINDVLKQWQGLGYYSRARNLHAAAMVVAAQYGGQLPADPALLARLPGIGAYTAGAIASIAYGLPAAAVDGNVLRVAARAACIREDIAKPKARKMITGIVQGWMDALPPCTSHDDNPCGDFTQALMELGATICTPEKPACAGCPVAALCQGYRTGAAAELPVKPRRPNPSPSTGWWCCLLPPRGWPSAAGPKAGCWPACGSFPQ